MQDQLVKRGKEKSKRLSQGVKIRLADGNLADQECPVVQLNVSTDLHKFSKPLALTFLVVKGPNNLVGRHSLARLWPTEFKAFKETTCKNYGISKSLNATSSNQINSTNVDKNNKKLSKSKSNSKNSNYSEENRGHLSNSAKVGIPAKVIPAKVKARENDASPHLLQPSSSPSPTLTQPVQTGNEASERPWP